MVRRLLFIFLLSLGAVGPLCGQIYRASDTAPVWEPDEENTPARWELAVGAEADTFQLQDFTGQSVFSGQWGLHARLLYSFWDWFSAGVDGAVLVPRGAIDGLSDYRAGRAGILLKFILTPNASPRAYFLAGAGRIFTKMEYWDKLEKSFASSYAAVGWGIEADLAENWVGGLELRATCQQAWDDPYFSLKHKWRASAQVQVGYRF